MQIFIFDCELFCEDCAADAMKRLRAEFPKRMTKEEKKEFAEMCNEGWVDSKGDTWDAPEHCASGERCANAITVGKKKIGCWLENELTEEGKEYVRKVVRKREGLCWELWAEWYTESFGLRVISED